MITTTGADIDVLPAATPVRSRPSFGAVADAVGHCVLVFAFLPALSALPAWLLFEATSRANLEDGVVLAFVPVRAAVLILHAFRAGLPTTIPAGLTAGVLIWAWISWRGVPSSTAGRLGAGAVTGALAAAVGIGVGLAVVASSGAVPEVPLRVLAFELGIGIVCGLVAAPRAFRILEA